MPARKSTAEKQKRGTSRGVREKAIKKESYRGYPDPGVELTEPQQLVYRRVCDHLRTAGILLDIDCYVVGSMAISIDTRNKAIQLMNKVGIIQEFENGTRNLSPEFSAFQKANTEIRMLSKQLGLDPKSRQDMIAFIEQGEQDDDDPLAMIGASIAPVS